MTREVMGWRSSRRSKHYRAMVDCIECHNAQADDPEAFIQYKERIAIIVPLQIARYAARQKQITGIKKQERKHE